MTSTFWSRSARTARWLHGASCIAVALLLPVIATAQTFPIPGKTVRLVSGASAGRASDIIGRAVTEKLQAEFGVPVVMENRVGASGTIATQNILASAPDGQRIFTYTAAHTVTPFFSKMPYDAIRDFAGVTPLAVMPNVMVTAPSLGYKNVKDVVDAARAKPGQLNCASVGVGTATYMNAEKFRIATAISAVHVPFKGSPEAITETVAERVDYFFAPLVSALPMIKAGKPTALAVGTTRRPALLPDVPTLAEAGVAKSDYLFWVGMLVSSKTARDIVQKINLATLKAMQAPEVCERFAALGADALPICAGEFDALIKQEMTANAGGCRNCHRYVRLF